MDITLHYKESGVGTSLILLHGNGEDCNYFSHQIAFFEKEYQVIALDTRGHGKSPRGNSPFSIAQFAVDLKDFMNQKKIEKAILLGFSDGGNIALEFALKNEERVEGLILNGANLDSKGVKRHIQIPIELGYKAAMFFAKKSQEAKKNAEILGLMVNEPNIDVSKLRELKVPTLVIAGKKDMIKDDHTKMIAEHIKGARLEILEGDHFIANKNHEAFNAVVDGFLKLL